MSESTQGQDLFAIRRVPFGHWEVPVAIWWTGGLFSINESEAKRYPDRATAELDLPLARAAMKQVQVEVVMLVPEPSEARPATIIVASILCGYEGIVMTAVNGYRVVVPYDATASVDGKTLIVSELPEWFGLIPAYERAVTAQLTFASGGALTSIAFTVSNPA